VRERGHYQVERWNYRRTKAYGSGHYLPESGEPGEERMPVAAARLSSDGKAVLLVLPDMKPVQQMQLSYQLRSEGGRALRDTLYLTVNQTPPLDLQEAGFGDVDWRAAVQRARQGGPQQDGPGKTVAATARRGRHLYQETGCVGCHNLEGPVDEKGQVGPSFAGLYGAERPLKSGETVTADEEYLRKSILNPNAQIVEGYETGMPAFEGVLQKKDIESMVLFIKSLRDSTGEKTTAAASAASASDETKTRR
jgi:mono/diheme cytochrome c family protein